MYLFGSGGEWIRELGLVNPVGTGGVLDVCLWLGCGGVGGERVWGLDYALEGWGGILESGSFV